MSHEFDRGVMNKSSWHGLEAIGAMPDAAAMIAHGEASGAWPVRVERVGLFAAVDPNVGMTLRSPVDGMLATYAGHSPRVLGAVGSRYTPTTPEQWRDLVRAACEAGAKPCGAFSLRGGAHVLAVFEVASNGFKDYLCLSDSFNGDTRLCGGGASVRVVCANTQAAWFSNDNKGIAKLRHTASLAEKARLLEVAIRSAIANGASVRELYHAAESTKLPRATAEQLFDRLWPRAPEGASKATVTRAEERRVEATTAMALQVNHAGDSVATMWNAATYLVDRRADGSPRKCRGGADMLDSMLFGSRAARVAEIQEHVVEIIMADGSVRPMTVPAAVEAGVDTDQLGARLLAEMLEGV